jgi:hypothetical protein
MKTSTNSLSKIQDKFLFGFLTVLTLFFFTCCRLHAQSWNALGSGSGGTVYALAVYNGELIAAGDFTVAGGSIVNRIARWNGTGWSALGTGTSATIYALLVHNSQLIAAGEFTTAGGIPANRIASWNGSTWTPLGLGMNNNVYALGVYSGQLRAGGAFTSAGGLPAIRIARWDGSSWFPMGLGANDDIYTMALYGADLVVGGRFTIAGGLPAKRIAAYNVNGLFLPMGSGMDSGSVNAAIVYGGNLMVGGSFTHIGGIPVNRVALWNGNNWFTVGSGTNNTVNGFTIFSGELITGGKFTSAGGVTANCVAKWNGTTWSALGTGMSGGTATVYSLGVWSNVLIAGGNFAMAGGIFAHNIAAWGSCPAAPDLILPPDGATGVSLTPTLDWSDISNATFYGVQVSTNPNFTTTVVNAAGLTNSQYTIPSGILNNNTIYFWRVNAKNGLCTGPYSLVRYFTTLITGIISHTGTPKEFKLYQNFPNPFNPTTVIKFDLPALNSGSPAHQNFTQAQMKLVIYDITGSEVARLLDEEYASGSYEIRFDASSLPSGIYFYEILAGDIKQAKRMMILK